MILTFNYFFRLLFSHFRYNFTLPTNPGDGLKITAINIFPPEAKEPLTLPPFKKGGCCFKMTVFADPDNPTSENNNDYSSFLFNHTEEVTGNAILVLQKLNGEFEDIEELTNNDFGSRYAYYVDERGRKYFGYKVEWLKVFIAHGEGKYRIKTIEPLTVGETNRFSQEEYCLKKYYPHLAEGTVKIDTIMTGILEDISFIGQPDADILAKPTFNSYRFEGFFGFDKAEYTREFVQLSNRKSNQKIWISDERTPKYTLELSPIPQYLRNKLASEIMQADEIFVTDFNSNNPNTHVRTQVISDGNFEPDYENTDENLNVSVSIEFADALANKRKRRC